MDRTGLLYHVYGTVDDDELLSLRFGDSAKEPMPKHVENYLCDVFWTGSMAVRLIETFSRGNFSVDFTLTVDPDGLHCWLWEVEAAGWKLDRREVARQLQLASPMQLCKHDLERLNRRADGTPVPKQEDQHDQGRGTADDQRVRRP